MKHKGRWGVHQLRHVVIFILTETAGGVLVENDPLVDARRVGEAYRASAAAIVCKWGFHGGGARTDPTLMLLVVFSGHFFLCFE